MFFLHHRVKQGVHILKKIIINYLNDSISSVDLERLKVWIQKPKNQEKFKDYVRIHHQLNVLGNDVDSEKAFQIVLKQLNKTKGSGSGGFRNVLKYAAILIGFSIIGYGIYQTTLDNMSTQSEPQIVLQLEDGSTQIVNEGQHAIISNTLGKKVTEQKESELVYATQDTSETVLRYNTLKVPYGKTFGITLSDGSKVTLNAGSELKYPVQFIANEKNRTVFLNGEAYFEVAKNQEHPFIVNTHDMDVEVLGTQFNVTSYTDDDKTYTVLVEGKVAAHNKLSGEESKILEPNQRVFFEGNQLALETVNVEKYVAWVNGQLIFVDDPYTVIKNKLERKYNIIINNSYAALHEVSVTATFTNETIDDVFKTFQAYQPFDYAIKNGVVTITKPK